MSQARWVVRAVALVKSKGKSAGVRLVRRALRPGSRLLVSGPSSDCSGRRGLRAAGLSAYSDPDHIEYTREASYDSPWAALVDAPGGLSLALYATLSRWKREAALRDPEESRGFQVLARRRP